MSLRGVDALGEVASEEVVRDRDGVRVRAVVFLNATLRYLSNGEASYRDQLSSV